MQAQPRSTARRGRPAQIPAQPANVGRRVPKKRYEDQLEDYEIRYAKPDRKFEVVPAEKQRFRKPVATVRPLIVQDKPGSQQPRSRRVRRARKQTESSAPRDAKTKPETEEPEKPRDRPAMENEVRVNRHRDPGYFAYQVRSKLKDHSVVICSAIGVEAFKRASRVNNLMSKDSGFCQTFRTDVFVLGRSGKAKLRFHYKKGENFEEISKKLDEQFSERQAKREAEKKEKEASEATSQAKSEDKSEEKSEDKSEEKEQEKAGEPGEE